MLEFCTGDLFADTSQALVNPVNCVGVSGKGLALEFKKRFPENDKEYADFCKVGLLTPGRLFVHRTNIEQPEFILNFPTKRHWRENSKIEDIEAGLQTLARYIVDNKLKSVAMPALGCGYGGLDWNLVMPLIEAELSGKGDIWIRVYEPFQRGGLVTLKPEMFERSCHGFEVGPKPDCGGMGTTG